MLVGKAGAAEMTLVPWGRLPRSDDRSNLVAWSNRN